MEAFLSFVGLIALGMVLYFLRRSGQAKAAAKKAPIVAPPKIPCPFKAYTMTELEMRLKNRAYWDGSAEGIAQFMSAVFDGHTEILMSDEVLWDVARLELAPRFPNPNELEAMLQKIQDIYEVML